MNSFSRFKIFAHFNKVMCVVAFSYIILIFLIIVLSLIIREQNRTILLLRDEVNKKQYMRNIDKSQTKKLLKKEYRMPVNSILK